MLVVRVVCVHQEGTWWSPDRQLKIRPGRIPTVENRVMREQVLKKQGEGNNNTEKSTKTHKYYSRYKRQLLSTFLNPAVKLDIVRNTCNVCY